MAKLPEEAATLLASSSSPVLQADPAFRRLVFGAFCLDLRTLSVSGFPY